MRAIIKRRAVIASVVSAFAVLISPVIASAADDSASTTINATIASVISISTSGTVAIGVTPTSAGAATSNDDTVEVSTNNAAGYNLTLSDSDTNTNLVNGGNNIAAHAGTWASPSTLANNSWGYRVDGAGSFGAGPTAEETDQANLSGTWAGVPSSAAPQQLKTTGSTATDDATVVWYGVKVDTSKPNGLYTDQVTYTATTN